MGNDSLNANKRKHIYKELNRTIDSFQSNGDNSDSDEEKKVKKKKAIKTNNNFNRIKPEKLNKELKKELIESSIIISDFLLNNIINKNTNRKSLPDANIVNSLLLIEEKGWKMDKQMDYCEQLLNYRSNNNNSGYKANSINNKNKYSSRDSLSFNSGSSVENSLTKSKIFKNDNFYETKKNDIKTDENEIIKLTNNNKDKMNILHNKTELKLNIKNNFNYVKENNDNNFNIDNNNNKVKGFSNYLYRPKQVKNYINKSEFINKLIQEKIKNNENKNFTEFNSNRNIFNNKSQIIYSKDNYLKKKLYNNNFSKISGLGNKNKYYEEKLKINHDRSFKNEIKNHKTYYNIDKLYKSRNGININKINDFSCDKIKNGSNKKRINKEIEEKIVDNNYRLNNTQNIINKKKYFNGINELEKSNNFNINNKDNNISITPYNFVNNKITKSTNFQIINHSEDKFKSKDSLFNINNNIELESEYRKSRMIFKKEINNNGKLFDSLNKSSFKEYVNKQATKIRQSPDYIKNKKMKNKKENSNYKNATIEANYFLKDKNNIYNKYGKHELTSKNNGNYIRYNLLKNSNISNGKVENKRTNNKKITNNIGRNHKNKKTNDKNIITIDLRKTKSFDRYKNIAI